MYVHTRKLIFSSQNCIPRFFLSFFFFSSRYIAYMFFVTSGGKRPVSVLQKNLKYSITYVVFLSGLSAFLDGLSYTKRLPINALILEVFFTASCLLFIIGAYARTCTALLRRNHAGVYSTNLIKARNLALAKLLSILATFIIVWIWTLGNNIIYLVQGESLAVDVPSALMAVLDSIILGGLFRVR